MLQTDSCLHQFKFVILHPFRKIIENIKGTTSKTCIGNRLSIMLALVIEISTKLNKMVGKFVAYLHFNVNKFHNLQRGSQLE